MGKSRTVVDERLRLVREALAQLSSEGCPAVPEDDAGQTALADQLIRRLDSVGRRHRRVDDRTRFLDLVRAIDGHPRDAECVAERTLASLGHPVPDGPVHSHDG